MRNQDRWHRFHLRVRELMAQGMNEPEAKQQTHREMVDRDKARKIEIEIEKEKAAAQAKTCQICGRKIYAETGTIAHHGYTRPGDGVQTRSCLGARELPYEACRDRLGWYVGIVYDTYTRWVRDLAAIENETVAIRVEWSERIPHATGRYTDAKFNVTVTRATFKQAMIDNPKCAAYLQRYERSGPTFDKVKHDACINTARQVDIWRDEHEAQANRWYFWQQTHQWNGEKGWERI